MFFGNTAALTTVAPDETIASVSSIEGLRSCFIIDPDLDRPADDEEGEEEEDDDAGLWRLTIWPLPLEQIIRIKGGRGRRIRTTLQRRLIIFIIGDGSRSRRMKWCGGSD